MTSALIGVGFMAFAAGLVAATLLLVKGPICNISAEKPDSQKR